MSYVFTTNLIQDLINETVIFFTSPTSPLRNRWVQTFIICLIIIAVAVGFYYLSGENNKVKPPPEKPSPVN